MPACMQLKFNFSKTADAHISQAKPPRLNETKPTQRLSRQRLYFYFYVNRKVY